MSPLLAITAWSEHLVPRNSSASGIGKVREQTFCSHCCLYPRPWGTEAWLFITDSSLTPVRYYFHYYMYSYLKKISNLPAFTAGAQAWWRMEHWVSLNVTLNLYGPQNRGICHFSLINTFQMDPDWWGDTVWREMRWFWFEPWLPIKCCGLLRTSADIILQGTFTRTQNPWGF